MKFLVFLLLFSIPVTSVFAQADAYAVRDVSVETITKTMSKGEQPGLKTNIYSTDKKAVDKAWADALKKDSKAKIETLNNEVFIIGGLIKSVSAKPLNVYSVINQYPDYLELNVFFEAENGFISKATHETEFLAAMKFVRDFAITQYKEAVGKDLKEEEKILSGLEKDLNDLAKENDKLHKKISDEKRSIDNTREKITTSELDQERVRKQVQAQKEELTRFKASGASETVVKESEKKLKDFEGEVKKLEKQEDGFHKDIVKSEANIREAERNIAGNMQAMELKRKEITAQKEHIHKISKKLEAIR